MASAAARLRFAASGSSGAEEPLPPFASAARASVQRRRADPAASTAGGRGVAARRGPGGQPGHQPAEAVALVGHRAEPLVEDDRVEPAVEAGSPSSRSLSKLNSASCEAGVEHALVAARDGGGVRRVAVGDGEEGGQQRARGGLQREVALVALHGGHEDVARQAQVALVEAAGDDARPLDQEHDLLELAAGVAPLPAGLRRGGVEAGDDAPPALVVARR